MNKNLWVIGATFVAILSFGGLYFVLTNLWPEPAAALAPPQLLLFAFMFFGVGATTIPLTTFFNQRFAKPNWLQRDRMRLLRQGAWSGGFFVVIAYLQLTKTLTITVAAVLAGVFILIEIFFLTRE